MDRTIKRLHRGLTDNEKERDLLHFTLTLSLVADVDPYGLIFTVLHVLNLHIYYKLDIWAILSAV